MLVANLQDPSISNTKIIIGPYGCAQELGTAAIVGAPEQTQNGHLITVLLPEGKYFIVFVTYLLYCKTTQTSSFFNPIKYILTSFYTHSIY